MDPVVATEVVPACGKKEAKRSLKEPALGPRPMVAFSLLFSQPPITSVATMMDPVAPCSSCKVRARHLAAHPRSPSRGSSPSEDELQGDSRRKKSVYICSYATGSPPSEDELQGDSRQGLRVGLKTLLRIRLIIREYPFQYRGTRILLLEQGPGPVPAEPRAAAGSRRRFLAGVDGSAVLMGGRRGRWRTCGTAGRAAARAVRLVLRHCGGH
jgi:hypothetical protein